MMGLGGGEGAVHSVRISDRDSRTLPPFKFAFALPMVGVSAVPTAFHISSKTKRRIKCKQSTVVSAPEKRK
jgi:hypothetical protein